MSKYYDEEDEVVIRLPTRHRPLKSALESRQSEDMNDDYYVLPPRVTPYRFRAKSKITQAVSYANEESDSKRERVIVRGSLGDHVRQREANRERARRYELEKFKEALESGEKEKE